MDTAVLKRFHRELGGYKAAMTRKATEARTMMEQGDDQEVIEAKATEFKTAYGRYCDKMAAFAQMIQEDRNELEMVDRKFLEAERTFNEFKTEFDEWIECADGPPSLVLTIDEVGPDDSVSQVSPQMGKEGIADKERKQKQDSISKMIAEKQALERHLHQRAEENRTLLRRIRESEHEQRNLQQRLGQVQGYVYQPEQPREYRSEADETGVGPTRNDTVLPRRESSLPGSRMSSSKSSESESVQFQSLLDAIQLPKTELMKFSGDPLRFWLFIRAFDNMVGRAHVDDAAKLSRLLQYCEGRALKVIECCAVMEPSAGYAKARDLLLRRFGNEYTISEAWITKITEGPCIKGGDKKTLQLYADDLSNCKETLSAMGKISEVSTQRTLVKIVDRLPVYLQDRWRKKAVDSLDSSGKYPDIHKLTNFITKAAKEANDPYYGKSTFRKSDDKKQHQQTRNHQGSSFSSQATELGSADQKAKPHFDCPMCSGQHSLFGCQQFKSLKPEDRFRFAREKKLCDNCLRPGHFSFKCKLDRTCTVDGCGKKHTKFLHLKHQEPRQSSDNQAINGYADTQKGQGAGTALPIIPVKVHAPSGNGYVETYALLDGGSTNTFCSDELCKKLNLKGEPASLSLTTLGREDTKLQTKVVKFEVSSLDDSTKLQLPYVFVKSTLPIPVNRRATPELLRQWPHLDDLSSEQDISVKSKRVGLLIGQDIPEALVPLEVRKGNQLNQPYATRTSLGWTINGPLAAEGSQRAVCNYVNLDISLENQVKNFWEMETMESRISDSPSLSKEDQQVLHIWEKSIRMVNGKYELDIPFRTRPPVFHNNYSMAAHRLKLLGYKLKKDQRLYEKYALGMQDMVDKGYAERVEDPEPFADQVDKTRWYVPHFAVFNPNKPDKIRIVFDCAAKHRGTSLNQHVMQGPDLTNSLIGVLLRFRIHPVAIMGDIREMYHQVRVTPSDRDVLRFLWWSNKDINTSPDTYRMATHLFGGIWSGSCASFALKRTAQDNQDEFDLETINTVKRNFYVDDCLKSLSTPSQAIHLIIQVCQLLRRGGFVITKWITNSKDVLNAIPEADKVVTLQGLDLDKQELPVDRALGINWNVQSDTLGYKIQPKAKPVTRRGILSVVSAVYDPLGFASPVTLKAKRIIQELCRRNIGWDEPVPDDLHQEWEQWLSELPKLENVSIARCLQPVEFDSIVRRELHHYADASEYGYGTSSYLRIVNADGQVNCSLLVGKSRLAPIKKMTIPRLELTAAVLATKMDRMLRQEIDLPIDSSTFWTDSTIVLQYIKNRTRRFHTFVANRVAAIHEQSEPEQWRHVSTDVNPADKASRGLTADALLEDKHWFHGPDILWQANEVPVDSCDIAEIPETDIEVKPLKSVFTSATEMRHDGLQKLFEHYSSWHQLKRAVAHILRLKTLLLCKAKSREPPKFECLTVEEIKNAEVEIVKCIQRRAYVTEIETLENDKRVNRHSSVVALDPFLNDAGVLCVGGRLQKANIPSEAKHQMLLPRGYHVTELIVRHYHEMSGHAGREHVLALLRERYWLVKARVSINSVLRNCFLCKRLKKPLGQQKMANLPSDRLTPGKPAFTYVAVDCFGPFRVKRGRSIVKRYGCLFTCLAIRAIHIEVLHSLDTDSFINGLSRFICRRGRPEKVRSDNGTNFVAADRELRELVQNWNQSKIATFLQTQEIEWQFNTPTASHMGGCWERMIRTVRKVLSTVVTEQVLDDEGLQTLMCQAESIVNGRPITPVSEDIRDCEPLTPNHLLLLHAAADLPRGLYTERDLYRRKWRQVQYLADVFWRRWQKEYLPTLQCRQKWVNAQENFKVGDLVLVANEQTPRHIWPLGRVVEVFPSEDGLVRSVRVKTRSTYLKRPIHKLCHLESPET